VVDVWTVPDYTYYYIILTVIGCMIH